MSFGKFRVLIATLHFSRKHLSSKAAQIGDEIKVTLADAMDAYTKSTHAISQWCDVAINRLDSYLGFLGTLNKDNAKKQQKIIIELLETGIQKVTEAQAKLEQASRNFNLASGKILAFTAQLNSDYDQQKLGNNDHATNLNAYHSAYNLCPFCGITIPTSEDILEAITNAISNMINYHARLRKIVDMANGKIGETKAKLLIEIRVLGELKTEAQVSLENINDSIDIGELDDVVRKEIKIPIERLIEDCRKYREQHV